MIQYQDFSLLDTRYLSDACPTGPILNPHDPIYSEILRELKMSPEMSEAKPFSIEELGWPGDWTEYECERDLIRISKNFPSTLFRVSCIPECGNGNPWAEYYLNGRHYVQPMVIPPFDYRLLKD